AVSSARASAPPARRSPPPPTDWCRSKARRPAPSHPAADARRARVSVPAPYRAVLRSDRLSSLGSKRPLTLRLGRAAPSSLERKGPLGQAAGLGLPIEEAASYRRSLGRSPAQSCRAGRSKGCKVRARCRAQEEED